MRSVAVLGLLLAVAAAGCSGGSDSAEVATTTAASAPVERYVSSADLGDAWPLTVPGGTLSCEGPGAVSFETDEGIVYAVNPAGASWSRTNNLAWEDIEAIQGDDPAAAGTRLALGPLIAAGLRLCRSAGQEAATTTG